MFLAALGDVILTLVAYVVISLASASWDWFMKKWTLTQWIVMDLTALVLSMYIEINALYQGRWSYTTINPLLPGTPISLIPIIQLLILFPLTFYVSAKVINKIRYYESTIDNHDKRRILKWSIF